MMKDSIDDISLEVFLNDISKLKASEVKDLIKNNLEFSFKHLVEVCNVLKMDNRKSVSDLSIYIEKEKNKKEAEIKRVRLLYEFDRSYGDIVCGVDEVGRGPLAGPIVGCAVILKNPENIEDLILEIDDSKKLTKIKREKLFDRITKECISYAIFEHSNQDIDNQGIAFCNNDIFLKAIDKLTVKPDCVLSDGYLVKNCKYKNYKVIKGDSKSAAIACASIIAKVYRDRLMEKFDLIYPGYGFASNVGYGSQSHIDSILEKGPCKIHRMSFLRGILSKKYKN